MPGVMLKIFLDGKSMMEDEFISHAWPLPKQEATTHVMM
tara:strand:+ start:4522 stop:4638 length:117 start_codon:yes stop_codon:yes gene_type:complete